MKVEYDPKCEELARWFLDDECGFHTVSSRISIPDPEGVPVWNIEGTVLGERFKEHLAKSEGNSRQSEGKSGRIYDESLVSELAGVIQVAIEGWLENQEAGAAGGKA